MVLNILEAISPYMTLVALASFFAIAVSFVKFIKNREKKTALILSVSALLISILLFYLQTYAIKTLIIELIENGNAVSIYWNERELQNRDQFLKALSSLYNVKEKSGSYPADKNEVNFIYLNKKHTFSFQKDSRDKEMYWVYYPLFKGKSEIGYVKLKQDLLR